MRAALNKKIINLLAGICLRYSSKKTPAIGDKEAFQKSHSTNMQKTGIFFSEKLRKHFRKHWIKLKK